MTTQQPVESAVSIIEIQDAFSQSYGPLVGRLTLENLDLKKQVQILQSRINEAEEVSLRIKQDNANLLKTRVGLEDQIHKLGLQLAERKTNEGALLDHIQDIEDQLKKVSIAKEIAEEAEKMVNSKLLYESAAEIAALAAANTKEKAASTGAA